MKIELNKYIKDIDIDKAKRVICLTFKNYRPDLNIDFLPGAIEVNSFQASKRFFQNIQEFYVLVKTMPYINITEINVPAHLSNTELVFEPIGQEKFEYYINGYLESFRDLSEDLFWNCDIKTKGFKSGYKLETNGSELILIGEFEENYFSFIYQSID